MAPPLGCPPCLWTVVLEAVHSHEVTVFTVAPWWALVSAVEPGGTLCGACLLALPQLPQEDEAVLGQQAHGREPTPPTMQRWSISHVSPWATCQASSLGLSAAFGSSDYTLLAGPRCSLILLYIPIHPALTSRLMVWPPWWQSTSPTWLNGASAFLQFLTLHPDSPQFSGSSPFPDLDLCPVAK